MSQVALWIYSESQARRIFFRGLDSLQNICHGNAVGRRSVALCAETQAEGVLLSKDVAGFDSQVQWSPSRKLVKCQCYHLGLISVGIGIQGSTKCTSVTV